jgi:hypothetical protein
VGFRVDWERASEEADDWDVWGVGRKRDRELRNDWWRGLIRTLAPLIVLGILVLAAHIGYLKVYGGAGDHGHASGARVCLEDSPTGCWDCQTMGNGVCGIEK